MKNLVLFASLFLLVAFAAYAFWARARKRPMSGASRYDTYLGLRDLALHMDRTKAGLPVPSTASEPWGAIMDWGMDKGTATVVAFSDGSASIYLSSGGGFLGGAQTNESVREAAKGMVVAATASLPQTHPTTAYPLPQKGEVIFYVLTDKGVLTASAAEVELRNNRHPLSKLGAAAQDVISQYRHVAP